METRDIIDHIGALFSLGIISKTYSWGGEELIDVSEICYEELIDSGFTEIDVVLEDGKEGKIIYTPDGREVYREIPVSGEWIKNVVKECLNHNES